MPSEHPDTMLEPNYDHEVSSDSLTEQIDERLMEKLSLAFENSSEERLCHDLAKIASEHDPVDLAYAAMRWPVKNRVQVYHNLPDLLAKIIFILNVDSISRKGVFRELTLDEIAEHIEKMPADEAVWVLEDLIPARCRGVLELLDPKKSNSIRTLQQHELNTAGRLMTGEFFAFTMETTIGEAAGYIRENPDIDLLRRVFVLDKDGILQGFVPARNLVINPPNLPLKKVMKSILHMVSPEATRDEVVEIFERYKSSDLPVVDEHNKLLGIVTYEDVMEAIEEIADETIAMITGTGQEIRSEDPVWKSFLTRAPWLVVTLVAGFVNASNLSFFGIASYVVHFVPLINGMSGNVGLQCSTVLLRGMATGVFTSNSLGKAVLKEVGTGMFTGLAFGILGGIFISILQIVGLHNAPVRPFELAIILSSGLFGACLIASMLGVASPIIFEKLGYDPAIASGPIVTALNDVLSTFMYFMVAKTVTYLLI